MPDYYCQLCGIKLKGRGTRFKNPYWHSKRRLRVCKECKNTKPRCKVCSVPLDSINSTGLCETCREHVAICLACEQPIYGGKNYIYGIGPYCDDCVKHRSTCAVCYAPITKNKCELSPGREMCEICYSTAIFDIKEARKIYEEVKTYISSTLDLKLNIPTTIELVDRKGLEKKIKENSNGREEFYSDPDHILGVYSRNGIKRGIYIINILPREKFIYVAAHEYAHAWQGENCPLLQNKLIYEGFAEWVAYKVLDMYGFVNEQERMLDRSDIYGQGLKWAQNLEMTHGFESLINKCLTTRN